MSGDYSIEVGLAPKVGEISGSPFNVNVAPAPIDPRSCTLEKPPPAVIACGRPIRLYVLSRDRCGNLSSEVGETPEGYKTADELKAKSSDERISSLAKSKKPPPEKDDEEPRGKSPSAKPPPSPRPRNSSINAHRSPSGLCVRCRRS